MHYTNEEVKYKPIVSWNCRFIKELGHYTQMLWADTYKVGCGYAFYKDGKWNRKLYVCNYGPAGNIITTEMYKRGAPCSACPEGTFCSQQYPGLCTSGPPMPPFLDINDLMLTTTNNGNNDYNSYSSSVSSTPSSFILDNPTRNII